MNKGPSLDEGLELMATAPLSPANWTRLCESSATAGDDTVVPHGSGGAPAAPVMAVEHGEGNGVRRPNLSMLVVAASQVNGGAPLVHGGLDLCGALSQANIDARSPAVRELRLALSFPDLEEGLPTDLLEATKLHEPPGRPTDHPVGDGYQHGLPERTFGKEANVLWQSPRGVLRSPKGKCGRMLPIDEFAPPWGSDNGGHLSGVIHDAANHEVAALELEPVGWERTEADWNDPSFPKWALACAPLATGEGGGPSSKRAFELCYREHFEWAGLGGSLGEADTTAKAEVEVVRRALAALQGVPSGYFWYDETHAQMRVCGHVGQDGAVEEAPLMPPRVAGLSPGALSSLLEEFAMAGTWYRRVQEFVRYLVNTSSSNGQVARAFGIELRRQLTEVQSALLGVTMELEGLGWNDSDSACLHGTQDTPLNEQHCCSLAGILAHTTQLQRAVGALAEICGLSEDDLRSAGGVRAVFNAFPRGASLLTYLYKAAEVRVASKPGGESTCIFGRVMAEGDSALALLSSAATPYLSMLGRWLWSGEMWAEDDPCEEFPLRCRERLTGSDTSKATKEPWTEDGGGSFMSLAFCENEAAGVPCFLAGGVLHAAARAGKLLRMLKAAASSGGAVSRARDSSTRCGKRDEDWNDTWGWERTVTGGREVGSREAPAEKPSPAAVYGGQGVLSFLDPPTSEAEAFAAAAITERYRVLGEEADARATRARWKRQRSARVVAARASLKMLYEEEMHRWEGMAAGAGPGAESHSTTAGHEAGVSDADNADNTLHGVEVSSADAVGGGPDSSDGTGGGQMGHVVEQAVAEGELNADSDGSRVEVRAEEEVGTIKRGRDSEGSGAPDKRPGGDDANISPVGILDAPSGQLAGVAEAVGSTGNEAQGIKFSHVTIVQEPGGKSHGVSGAFAANIDGGGDDATTTAPLPGRSGVRRIVQEPGGNSSAVSRILSHDSADGVDKAPRAERIDKGEDSRERDNENNDVDTVRWTWGRMGMLPFRWKSSCADAVDWRRSSNLDAAFAASALATGLDSVPLAETFRYEVDPTCGGILGSRPATGSLDLGRRAESSGMTGGPVHSATATITTTTTRAELSLSSSLSVQEEELYSPVALSFVSPVLEVKWPVGVLLPTGVLHTYGSIHRSLIRHQLALHRLRRLRLVLRELDACLDAASGGGIGGVAGGGRRSGRGGGSGGGDSSSGSSRRQREGARVSWDRGRLHWLHLFRHEMQHMADSLQSYFAEQAEADWPDLRRSLAVAGGGAARGGGGSLAALVAAHSRYITKMQRYMFLGTDRQGAVARGSIGEFYAVICTVGRITDGLLSSKPSRSPPASVADVSDGTCTGSAVGEMVLPDEAFAELAAVREKFDAARRGLCAALSEICAAGGGTRARPLLSVIGYGGYGGDDFVVAADLSR
ncbi:unnamed protein product [Ectocarpus sp. 6 AP-2014]